MASAHHSFWGGSVGDQPLVVVEGRAYAVSAVAFDGRRIRVDVEPLPTDPDDRA